ncbi:uncharacterized protein PAC_03552 [Phialocephala subalpina]|uniref:Uncharacterized protein n=1 Tax=Phialocephala subalpina TaxID=576137 RepID=A0A1L7WLM1_9HELO|nr:uncharacterized protein PAC_03552 [Phialocephala subalpina]
MTSKKNKKRKFLPRDFLNSPPAQNPNAMPPVYSAASPPSGPRAEQIKIKNTGSRGGRGGGAPRGGRRAQDDSRERRERRDSRDTWDTYRPRSASPRPQSPPYRDRSPERRKRDRRQYENNYRPIYDTVSPLDSRDARADRSYGSYSPASTRSFVEEKRSYDSIPQARSRPPLEERASNNNSPLVVNPQLTEPIQLQLQQVSDPIPKNTEPNPHEVEVVPDDHNPEVDPPQASETSSEYQGSESPTMKPTSSITNAEKARAITQVDKVSFEAQSHQAPVSDSVQLQVNDKLQEVVTNQLGEKLLSLLSECTNLSSLKFQQSAEKQRLSRRKAEYRKFQSQHEKFPSTKEAQTRDLKDAENALKLVSNEVESKTNSLAKSTKEAVSYLVPSILASGYSNQDSSENEKRLAKVEKTCEGYAYLLEEQMKLYRELEAKHSQLAKSHEDEKSTWQAEIKNLRSQSKLDLDRVSNQVTGMESGIKLLRDDISDVKRAAIGHSQTMGKDYDDIASRLTAVEGLAKRVPEITALQLELTRLEGSSVTMEVFNARVGNIDQKLNQQAERMTQAETTCQVRDNNTRPKLTSLLGKVDPLIGKVDSLIGKVDPLAGQLDSLAGQVDSQVGKINPLVGKVDSLVGKIDSQAGKVSRLESLSNRPSPVVKPDYSELIKAHIDPLKQEVSKLNAAVTGQNAVGATPGLAKPSSDVVNHRLSNFDRGLNDLEQRPAVQAPAAVSQAAPASSNGPHNSYELNALKTRLTTLESSKPDLGPILNRLAVLETEHGGDLAILDKSMRAAQQQLTDIEPRLTTVEQRPIVQTPAAPVAPAQAGTIPANATLAPRVARVETDLQIVRGSLDALGEMVGDIVEEQVKASIKPLELQQTDSITKLQTSIDSLRKDHDILSQETKQTISGVMASVTTGAAHSAIHTINSQGIFARSDMVNQLQTTLNGVHATVEGVHATVESHDVAIGNVQSRLDNINTAELHKAIVYNVLDGLPNLQNAEARIAEIQTSITTLQAVEPRVSTRMDAVELSVTNQAKRIQNMRDEIDVTLTPAVTNLQSSTKNVEGELGRLLSTYNKGQETMIDNFEKMNEKVADLGEEVEKVQKANAKKAQDRAIPAVTRPSAPGQGPTSRQPSTSSNRLNSPAGSVSSTNRGPASRPQPPNRLNSPAGSVSSTNKGPTNANARPASRPGSVTSAASAVRKPSSVTSTSERAVSESKKRPFPSEQPKQTNSKPSSSHKRTNGSPAAKKPRRKYGELGNDDDRDQDPDFDPDDGNLVEPRISDSESDEPISPLKKSVKGSVNVGISERVRMDFQAAENVDVKPRTPVIENSEEKSKEKPKEVNNHVIDLVSDSDDE